MDLLTMSVWEPVVLSALAVFVGTDVSVSPSAGVLTVFASSSMVVPGIFIFHEAIRFLKFVSYLRLTTGIF